MDRSNNAALYGPLPVKNDDIRAKYEMLAGLLEELAVTVDWNDSGTFENLYFEDDATEYMVSPAGGWHVRMGYREAEIS